METYEHLVFDEISQRIRNWRRFGRLIGVDDYILDNIEEDYRMKDRRLYECILYKKESTKNGIGWSFWKEKLLRFDEGREIIHILENKFPSLSKSISKQDDDDDDDNHGGEETKYMLIDIFDTISMTLRCWRSFAKVLDIDHISREIDGSDRYKDHLEEAIYACIKKIRSPSTDWCYWRNILLKIKEQDLIEDIEMKYPVLLNDERIVPLDVVHKAFGDFGILAHNAANKRLFEKLPLKLKDKIEICVGAGDISAIKDIKDIPTLQENYFKKYPVLENIKIYDFTNNGKTEECKILQTMNKWLHKHDDSGFTIKGYDVKYHAQCLFEGYDVGSQYKHSYILTYSEKHNVVFYIDTAPVDVTRSIRDNISNLRYFNASHQCLNGKAFVYVPVTLVDPNNLEVINRINCKKCADLQLIVSADIFKELHLFEKWWGKLSTEVQSIISELKEKSDMSIYLLRSVIGLMAIVPFELPNYTNTPKKEIQQAQKLLMLTPEQQDIIYSNNKRKIIRGSFGSGKTIAAQQLMKLATSTSSDFDFVYYIIHATDSAYVQEMNLLTNTLEKKNTKACTFSDFIGENRSLSALLQNLIQINANTNRIHVFIEEFNGEVLDREEAYRISVILKNKVFKDSHIVIVCQSMEIYQVPDKNRKTYNSYQFEELSAQSDFQIFDLSYLLRSSQHINNIVDVAIPILSKAIMKSVVPKLHSKSNISATPLSKNYNTKNILNGKLSKSCNFLIELRQSSTIQHSDVSFETTSTKVIENDLTHLNDQQVTDDKVSAPSSSSDQNNNFVRQSNITTAGEQNVLTTETACQQRSIKNHDTAKLLKHFTVNSNQYDDKMKLKSSYRYVGERKTTHTIKEKKPIVYYPFKKQKCIFNVPNRIKSKLKGKNLSYMRQIFCLSKVLKKIERNSIGKEKPVIICMNAESEKMIRDALKINETVWTDDVRLLLETEFQVLLMDYTSVRGCEFQSVILIFSIDEQHLKHNLVDCLSRCVLNLSVIVINQGIHDKTLRKILHKWKYYQLVEIENEDYLKNSTREEWKSFQLDNKNLSTKVNEKQIFDIGDAEVIQNFFIKNNLDTRKDTERKTFCRDTFFDIWNVCEEAARNDDVILMLDSLKQNKLSINSTFEFDDEYCTAGSLLHYAVYEEHTNVVSFLLKMNIDVNLVDTEGETALYKAACLNCIDIVKILLQEKNIDLNKWKIKHI